MTTIPCDECNGTGFINDGEPCTRIRCVWGHIDLTDAEVKEMEAEQAVIRG